MADRRLTAARFELVRTRRYMKCMWPSKNCKSDRAWIPIIRARSTLCEDHLHKILCEVACSWRTAY